MPELAAELLDEGLVAAPTLAPGQDTDVNQRSTAAPIGTDSSSDSLKILHVFRAPIGGLFRHVLDVARGQAARGHRVGLIVDSMTGGARAEAALAELAPRLALGIERIAIPRQLSLRDLAAVRHVARKIAALEPDVLHGHGAKGAALVRLARRRNGAIRVCTPHGGTLVYAPGTLAGGFYRMLELALSWRTDLFLFESNYAAAEFSRVVGPPGGIVRIACNGVGDAEFMPIPTRSDTADIICIGELRPVKGFDILLEALAKLKRSGRVVRATIAGEGPDASKLKNLSEALDLAGQIQFAGHLPARDAFAMGRIMVMPSRAESLPYVILEAAAAGLPIIATRVGGLADVFGPQSSRLVPPGDAAALAEAIGAALADPLEVKRVAAIIQARVRSHFTINAMVDGGLAAYRDALAKQAKQKAQQFA
jgi:glycosyltransferase involved in cell wall biosynthesis